MKKYRHGGERFDLQIAYDFSVNMNPFGLPKQVKEALLAGISDGAFERYPDADCRQVRRLLAQQEGVESPEVVCGNGASELLYAATAGLCREGRAVLVSPCFLEYERALQANGAAVIWYDRRPETGFVIREPDFLGMVQDQKPDLLILCHPGNPVGELLPLSLIKDVLQVLQGSGGVLLLDECFLPFAGGGEELDGKQFLKDFSNLLILKAYTKIYAMAGLRFGYLMGNAGLIKQVKGQLPEWNVSAPAQLAAEAVLRFPKEMSIYMEETEKLIRQEKAFLEQGLKKQDFQVYDGAANFLFFRGQAGLYEDMLKAGILIRQCANYRGLDECCYRIAVRSRAENEALLQAFADRRRTWRK